jgi:hypothetical protein
MTPRGDEASVYWFRLPDDEAALMSLRPAELKCYLVVTRAIQRDRNGGRISERQVSQRAGVSLRHAHDALARLVELDRLRRKGKPGSTAKYSLPHAWHTGSSRIPTGKQVRPKDASEGEQHCSPVGARNCTPVGEQHLEPSEPSHSAGFVNGSEQAWPRGEWASAQDFEKWWARLVWGHPNRNQNAVAKTKALQLIMAGTLKRAEFEEGYARLQAAHSVQWSDANGRYAPNLWKLLDDQAWKYAPPAARAAPTDYQSAEEYLRRIESE